MKTFKWHHDSYHRENEWTIILANSKSHAAEKLAESDFYENPFDEFVVTIANEDLTGQIEFAVSVEMVPQFNASMTERYMDEI